MAHLLYNEDESRAATGVLLQTSTQSATEGARSVAEPSREKMQSSITSTLDASHRTKCLELLERDSSHIRLGKAADGGEPQALNPGCDGVCLTCIPGSPTCFS